MKKACPECEKLCLPVDMKTMLHHVQYPENQSLLEGDCFYCDERNCKTAYFSGSYAVYKSKLRVFQVHQSDLLCYCFDISRERYQAALKQGQAQPIKDFVVQQTKGGLCACEIRNPSGRCCLVDFKQLEKQQSH